MDKAAQDALTMEKAAQEAFDECNRSVVHVFWKTKDTDLIDSTGTGFIAWTSGRKCLVVTCNHCTEGGEFNPAIHKLVVRLSGDADNDLKARRVGGDVKRDIAVLYVETVGPPPPPLSFAEEVDELPLVQHDIVVALGFCVPDKDEDENEDDDEDESKNEDESEDKDLVFVYPEEPSAFPGKISMEALEIDDTLFHEIYKADCGLMKGCSGGPLVYGTKVVGVATHTEVQVEWYVTPKTVKAVFQTMLNLGPDDECTIPQLLDHVSEL